MGHTSSPFKWRQPQDISVCLNIRRDPAKWLSCSKPIDFDWNWKHEEFCRTWPQLWEGDYFPNLFLIKLEIEGANVIYSIKWRPAFHGNTTLVTFRGGGEGRGEIKATSTVLAWNDCKTSTAASFLSLGWGDRREGRGNGLRYC